jgi:TolB-like protein/Tfp pilus assembly protein PilF
LGTLGQIQDTDLQVAGADVAAALEAILNSQTFRAAKAQQKFLRYVVELTLAGESKQIKEVSIGMDVLRPGKPFDPRLDNIVRVEARKLRLRLAKYYETEGVHDPTRIDLPPGGYVPVFRSIPTAGDGPALASQENDSAEPAQTSDAPANLGAPRKIAWLRTRVGITASCVGLLFAVATAAAYIELRSKPVARLAPSVAVLPFRNLGEIREDESFSDGLADELIDSLGTVPGLRVVARTSAFQFRNGEADIHEIARKLKVQMVLEGSVAKYGDHLRISAQLDDTNTGYRLWSATFDRRANDALDVQREISLAIVQDLQRRFSMPKAAAASTALDKTKPVNPEAFRDYLRGVYFWNKNTAAGLQTAISYFQKAVSEDPGYARAWAGLARCYVGLPSFSALSANDAASKIRDGAQKSLALDSVQGESHIYLGYAAMLVHDWPTAAKEFEIGLALEPGNAVGHRWYANYLLLIGQPAKALTEGQLADDLDPVSPYMMVGTARTLRILGRDDEAVALLKKALDLDPGFVSAHQGLADVYLHQKKYAETFAELRIAEQEAGGSPRHIGSLAYAYAVSGRPDEARSGLNTLLNNPKGSVFAAKAIAQIYIGLGDRDRAFEFLGKAIDAENTSLLLKVDPLYAALRSDPRFGELLAQMNLQ